MNTPYCSKSCQSGYSADYSSDKHFGGQFYSVAGVKNIMKELHTNGPVEASFVVYEDFLYYKSGMLSPMSSQRGITVFLKVCINM